MHQADDDYYPLSTLAVEYKIQMFYIIHVLFVAAGLFDHVSRCVWQLFLQAAVVNKLQAEKTFLRQARRRN
jgi:hypothetical protein